MPLDGESTAKSSSSWSRIHTWIREVDGGASPLPTYDDKVSFYTTVRQQYRPDSARACYLPYEPSDLGDYSTYSPEYHKHNPVPPES